MRFKQLFGKNRPSARPTGETGSEDVNQAQPKPKSADRVAKETPDSARSEESAFGIKLLVPGEAPCIE